MTVTLLVLFMSLIGFLALHVNRQLQRLEDAASEAVLWSLTQAELEASRLEAASMAQLLRAAPPLEELRIRFDVFYSRFAIVRDSSNYAQLQDLPESLAAIERIETLLNAWIPLVDGADETLRQAMPRLVRDASEIRDQTRILSLDGITRNAIHSAEQRASISATLTHIALLTAILIAVLLALMAMLFRLARLREAQSRRNEAMRRRLETIFSTSLDAIIVTDTDGCIIEYNGAAEDIFGFTRAEAIGVRTSDLIIPPEHRLQQRAARNAFLSGSAEQKRRRFIAGVEGMRKSGERFPVETSIASAMTDEGELVVSFLRDISDRKAAEAELLEARDKAIAGERSKARLLAVMSHEMRTPLNGILGTLDLIGERDLPPRIARYLEIVRNSAKMLLDQVNDVLDLSRLDAQKMQTDKRLFDLVALAGEIVESQVGAAASQGNRLTLVPPSPLLHRVWSDPDRLRQILLNLLSNAIKFTRDGEISLEIDCSAGLDEVELRITDTGIGIAEDDLERIFGDFVTLDTSYQRSNKGTGLGLGIARRLTRALGGEIGAESEPGDGSIFWVRLPLEPPEDIAVRCEDNSEPAPRPGPALRALIIEDNAVNRLILRRMLEKDGHAVAEAADGSQGVALAAERDFDVIFMDISMPGMDGIVATKAIRERSPRNADTRIIATTAHALPDEQKAFTEAGMRGVLLKPLTRNALRYVLAEKEVPEPPRPAGPPPMLDPEHLATLTDLVGPQERDRRMTRFMAEIDAFLDPAQPVPEAETMEREAHRLAGSAGLFGALRMATALQKVEAEAPGEDEAGRLTLRDGLLPVWMETRVRLEEIGAGPT